MPSPRAQTAPAHTPNAGVSYRLGRVETTILRALERTGGLMRREEALLIAYPDIAGSAGRGAGAHPKSIECYQRRRALAQSGLSRAVATLERKGLIVRERDVTNSATVLRISGLQQLPEWEHLARAEDDLAALCGQTAATWDALARRARSRANSIRVERSLDVHEEQRRADLKELDRLAAGTINRRLGTHS